MKIGILTYHRAENYGALLQAYALRTYLQGLDHDVLFVDYWPDYHRNYFSLISWKRFRSKGLCGKKNYLLDCTIWLLPRFIRHQRLQKFIHEKLDVPKEITYNEHTNCTEKFDLVLYGSDQIWRKQKLGGVGFDDWYFGANCVKADQKIVYAGSMGAINCTKDDDQYLRMAMNNFQSISVREKDLRNYLEILGIKSQLVIDPVFLLTKNQWMGIARQGEKIVNSPYIFFYNLLNSPESKAFADNLSRETGLPIREVNKKMTFMHLGKRYISTASVETFLRLLSEADYVVSNSFHGVAFSLIFQKQFYAVGMRERSNRVESLLESLGVGERYFATTGSSVCKLPPINYAKVMDNLDVFLSSSKRFLNYSIGE